MFLISWEKETRAGTLPRQACNILHYKTLSTPYLPAHDTSMQGATKRMSRAFADNTHIWNDYKKTPRVTICHNPGTSSAILAGHKVEYGSDGY